MAWSTPSTIACSTAAKIRIPPGAPRDMQGRRPRNTMVGDMLLSTRFPGAMELARFGCGSKMYMVLLSTMPVPGTVRLAVNASRLVWGMASTLSEETYTVWTVDYASFYA